jgi:regulator of protease activity HflC (stomatin/prohibitin superfamily)
MGKLRILSKLGDTTVLWDEKTSATDESEAAEAVREAERIFNQERASGATAFRVAPNRAAERIETFDPRAEQIVMVPRVAGG